MHYYKQLGRTILLFRAIPINVGFECIQVIAQRAVFVNLSSPRCTTPSMMCAPMKRGK